MDQAVIQQIQVLTEEFFSQMGMPVGRVAVVSEDDETVDVSLETREPQLLIGQNGQTLLELQRILKMVLVRKLARQLRLRLDINGYHKEKVEYLKKMAQSSADEVAVTGQQKVLPSMSSYERRIIHEALSQREDVKTESQGEGDERQVVIVPK